MVQHLTKSELRTAFLYINLPPAGQKGAEDEEDLHLVGDQQHGVEQ